MSDVEKEKEEITNKLRNLYTETLILADRIFYADLKLKSVRMEEELEGWKKANDLERDLEMIRIFG